MLTDDFLKNNPNVNITVSAADLQKVVDYAISRTRSEFEESKNDSKSEAYYTIAETAKELKVSKVTLFRWNRDGYLTHISIGGKRRYKVSDINNLKKSNV
jgi:excisionase family DNA binding protein